MIFVLGGALIGLVVWLRWIVPGMYREGTRYGKLDGLEVCFGVVLLTIFGLGAVGFIGLVGMGVGTVVGTAFKPEYTCQEIRLANLQDRAGVEGRFFLGSGYIGEEMRYAFYYDYMGGYRLALVDADEAVVFQDEEAEPYVVVCKREHTGTLWIDWSGDEYEFHVPEGSMLTEYRLDAQ